MMMGLKTIIASVSPVEGFDGQQVRVYTVDGRQVSAFVAGGNRTLTMEPGIYIVTVGKQAMKVMVK